MSLARGALQMDEIEQARMLAWRGVTDPCEQCHGSGVRTYGSTATWRGGMGGAMVTQDVCDVCWSTGDKYRRGVDLKALRDEEAVRVAKEAVDLLARSVGASFSVTRGNVLQIIQQLRAFATKRSLPAQTADLSEALADTLERALK